jgi:transcriptional regulator with GAF, ATPase, and Fis domain
VIRGAASGRVFPVGDELSIGREPENTISVLEAAVSRRHCLIRREGSSYLLRDMGSRNATLVNGTPVKEERLLADGDQITVGGSSFLFRTGAKPRAAARGGHSTVILRAGHAKYLTPDPFQQEPAGDPRTVRDLKVLLGFSQTINSARGLEAVERKVVESIAEVTPADRIALLQVEEGTAEVVFGLGWDREQGLNESVPYSMTVVRQVVDERAAVLTNDVLGLEAWNAAASLVDPGIRSVLAAPMEVHDKLLGVIYLDSVRPAAAFDEGHLHLVSGLGSVAALAMENARHTDGLIAENQRLQEELSIQHDMVGSSPSIQRVYQFIERVAGRDSNVLIWGESGTGKELVARAIHRNSERAGKPFVAINCAAIADSLLESELFGHEKGAFTGAAMQKKGKLEVAEGGTVFLDEIGELAPLLQAKLLRVLQEREMERVGGTKPIKLDIRLIAATNRDLKEASQKGTFREDLYYRLNVVSVRMPALRERREDIPQLAGYFAQRFAEKVKRRISGISPAARSCMMQYEWPGNVRELENAIERAVVLGSTDQILPEDLPEAMLEEAAPDGKAVTALHDGLREAKKRLIEKAIQQCEGNYTEAAHVLGIHPNHLFRLIKGLGMKPKRGKSTGEAAGG